MSATKPKLIGSAPSSKALLKQLSDSYFYSPVELVQDGKVWRVKNSDGIISGFMVRESKGRWRFEMVDQP